LGIAQNPAAPIVKMLRLCPMLCPQLRHGHEYISKHDKFSSFWSSSSTEHQASHFQLLSSSRLLKQLKIGVVVAEQRFRTYSVLLKFSHGPDVVDGGVRQGHVRARLLRIPVLALALEMIEDRKP
jgi:hypothetical protein